MKNHFIYSFNNKKTSLKQYLGLFVVLSLLLFCNQVFAQLTTPTVADVNRCGAGTATITASGAPMGGSYRWYTVSTGGTPIVGATTASFVTPTLNITTEFYVSAVSADGMMESARAKATVNVLPLPTAQILQGAIIGYCGTMSITLNALQVPGATYQWQRFSTLGGGSFQNEMGAGNNTPNYTVTSPTRGFFRVAVTAMNGCTAFSPVIEVLPDFTPEAIIVQGTMGTICQGQPFTLQAKVDEFSVGNSYQWTFSTNNMAFTDIMGATMNSFNATNAGFYRIRVTKNGCSATSTSIQLTQNPTPTASILQGATTNFCLGGNVVLNSQTDIGNQYLWLVGGSPTGPFSPASGTNNTANYIATSSGFYIVEISLNGCSRRSTPISVTQEPAPIAMITNNNPTSYCFGSNVILNAQQATGNQYQWKFSASLGGTFTDLMGATSASYPANQVGFYRVEVRRAGCNVASLSNPIEVTETKSAIQQAPLASFCKGANTTLNAVAVANATYQWQFSTSATGTFANATGTSNIANYTANVAGFYRLNVTKDGCTHTSDVMQVKEKSATIAQGTNTTFCRGGSATLVANEIGTGLTYLWLYATTLTGTYNPASGTNNAATYSAGVAGFYRIRITDSGCESTSDPISVTESPVQPTALILQGTAAQFCVGGDVILNALPQPGATYLWQFSPTAMGVYMPASGTNNTANYTANVQGFFTLTVSNGGCSITSTPINVTQTTTMPKPIIQQGGTAFFCTGGSVTTFSLLGMTGVTYQWQFSPTATGTFTPASGTNNQQSYTTGTVGFLRVQVSRPGCGTNVSDPVEVKETFNKPVAKILQGSPSFFCAGGDVTLDAQTGAGYQYVWQYGTTATGTFSNAGGMNTLASYNANQVGFYRVQVTLGGCTEVSAPVQVQQTAMTPKPTIDQGAMTSFCQGGSALLSTPLKGTGYTYQWQIAPTATGNYVSATGMATNFSNLYLASQAGFYRVIVTIPNCGSATSDPIQVTQSAQKPIAQILQGTSAQFCVGGDVILDALQGVGYQYQWKYSTTQTGMYANAAGVNNTATYTATDAGFYVVEVNLNGCAETSAPIAVTTTTTMPKPIILQGGNASFCVGGSVLLNAQTKSTRYTYRWEFSATQTGTYAPASGTNNQDNYTATVAGFYRLVTNSPTCGTGTSDPIQVRVSTTIPTARILQGATTQFCANGDIILDAETGTNYAYNWQFSTTATGTFADALGDNKKVSYIATAAGFYRVIVTLDGCSATSSNISVTSTAAMPKPIIGQGGSITFCAGGNVTLTALTKSTKYTYQWLFSTTATGTFANATGTSNQDNYTTTTAGFYRLRTTSDCGTADSDPTEVRVTTERPKAEIIQAPAAQFCTNGGDVILEAVTGTGYVYQWKFSATQTGTYANASGNSTQASYATNVAGFYLVEVNLNGCVQTSAPVQVSGTPTMPPATIVQSGVIQFCKGESTVLNAKSKGTNYQYQWLFATTASGIFTNASGASTAPNYTANTAGFYRLRTTLTGCGTATSDPIEVRETPFTPNPVIRQAPTASLCAAAGSDVFLEVIPEPNVTYTWFFAESRTGEFKAAEGRNADTLYAATKAGFYRVTATLGACVKTSEITEVRSTNMLPAPLVAPSGRVFFCRGGNVVLRSLYRGTNVTYQWQSASTATGNFTNVANGNAFSLNVNQAGFYRVTISAIGCGTATSAVVEVVETTVQPTATILQGQRAEFCVNGGDVLLEAQTNPLYSYQWKFSATAGGNFANATGVSNLATYLANVAGFYIVEINVNGCRATSQPIQVVGVTTVSRPNIVQGTTVEFCQGDNAILQTTTKGTGYVYRWTFATSATGIFEQASGNATTDTYTTTVSGFYRLEISRQGCGSNTSEIIAVTVKPRPVITFGTARTIDVCEGGNAQLSANEVAGASYAWRGANNFTANTRNPNLTNLMTNASGFYVLTLTSANGCTVRDSVLLRVNARPTFTATVTDNVCANDRNGVIRLSGTGNLQFRLGNTGNYQAVTSFNNLAVGSYTVFARNELGCEGSQTVNVRATNPAGAQVNAGADVTTTKGKAIRLLATNVASYRWSPSTGLSDPTIADPVANPLQTTTYTVTGTDQTGCTSTDEITVTVIDNGEIVVTNLLTPDGNGINDTWEIVNIERYPDAEVKVYDRWGLEVFNTVGYNNNWDGRSKSGEKLPDGAYYYQVIVNISGQRRTITGGMNIMR
jgi:gliding motility-associated-like protein